MPGTTDYGDRGTRPCGPRRPCWPAIRPPPTGSAGPGGTRGGNPIALAIVERSAALAAADRDGALAAAERLSAAGCRYQWARTLVLADGPERAHGEAELAAMGATPMAAG